ncbi:hypothetical protein AX16_001688 [Volvariella volvacea WC 439]|nr:hypothetical protein AX16_001688 [Volvariella volvacea WC 439]
MNPDAHPIPSFRLHSASIPPTPSTTALALTPYQQRQSPTIAVTLTATAPPTTMISSRVPMAHPKPSRFASTSPVTRFQRLERTGTSTDCANRDILQRQNVPGIERRQRDKCIGGGSGGLPTAPLGTALVGAHESSPAPSEQLITQIQPEHSAGLGGSGDVVHTVVADDAQVHTSNS